MTVMANEKKTFNFWELKEDTPKVNTPISESINSLDENNYEHYFPSDTKIILNTRVIRNNDGPNFSLQLNKFAKPEYQISKNNEPKKLVFKLSPRYFDENLKFFTQFKNIFTFIEEYYKKVNLFSLEKIEVDLSLKNKFVSGLGASSIFETSITLHHIYGIPYIPGQAIKGGLRSFYLNSNYDQADDKEFKAVTEDLEFCKMFGCSAKIKSRVSGQVYDSKLKKDFAGDLVFFDAFPSKEMKLELDIMNPHYSEYYNKFDGKKAPTDDMSPVPINFVVVKDASFKFLIGAKQKDNNQLSTVKTLLINCLYESGIGAKTSVGYGIFNQQ